MAENNVKIFYQLEVKLIDRGDIDVRLEQEASQGMPPLS